MVKLRAAPIGPAEFERELEATGLRPPEPPYHEWTCRFVGRYLYGVRYNKTTGDMQGIVEQCDKQKDGIEAYRLLSIHCDRPT